MQSVAVVTASPLPLCHLVTFFAPQTGTPSSLRDTPSNRGNYLTGESHRPLRGVFFMWEETKKICPLHPSDTSPKGRVKRQCLLRRVVSPTFLHRGTRTRIAHCELFPLLFYHKKTKNKYQKKFFCKIRKIALKR